MLRTGGCLCGAIRYRVSHEPLFLHACHCTDCQTTSGSAFSTTWITENSSVELLQGTTEVLDTISGSGKCYELSACGACGSGLWAVLRDSREDLLFLRAGTLDETDQLVPMAHIYTRSKQAWVILPDNVPLFVAGYQTKQVWPPESLERLQKMLSG